MRGDFRSDCAPLGGLVAAVLEAGGGSVHTIRDLTRGGLAAGLNEIARQSAVSIGLVEEVIPLRLAARAACDLLGYDALTMANEGKIVVLVAPDRADDVLAALRSHALGRDAAAIGEVTGSGEGRVTARTALGPARVVDLPSGELLPRIC